jgi:hypothetical protein
VPTIGTAQVDCDAGEWDLAQDFFANLNRGWDPTKPVEAKVYLRYECVRPLVEPPATQYVIVYALVKAESGVPILVNGLGADPSMAHIKIQDISNSPFVSGTNDDGVCVPPTGTPPEFAWLNKHDDTIDGTPVQVADGWEASFQVPTGSYTKLLVHTQVYDGGAGQTAGVQALALDVSYCPPDPTAVTLANLAAAPAGNAIQVNWETASELDSLGFNLYRATSATGPRTRLNASLIYSQAPGSPLGQAYQFVDAAVRSGVTYYYWLEAVDTAGGSAINGPVSATVAPLRRAMPVRPRLAPGIPGFRNR